jgi:FkbM family methyltransferase
MLDEACEFVRDGSSPMENILIRLAWTLSAKAPRLYLATLKALRRGSPEKRLYLSVVSKGDVVIDIGANVGYYTRLFADLVGPAGEVHAFEPVPSTFELLAKDIRRFPRRKNVLLNCVALGDGDRNIVLFVPNGDHGQAALVQHRDGSWRSRQSHEVHATMIRLDRYAERLAKIDFVKCDVEGAELLVLRGGEATLRRCRPKIFLEIEERWTNSFGWTGADVIRFLRDIGYQQFYELGEEGLRTGTDSLSDNGVLCTWEKIGGLA